MKTSLRPQEITTTFYTLSTSLLLCSSMEVWAWPAEETSQPWYGRTPSDSQDIAPTDNDPVSSKSPALFTLKNGSGHTQRVGLISGQNQVITRVNGMLVTPAMVDSGKNKLNLQGDHLGAYWSLTGPAGWHVDLSASGGRVNGYSRTEQGQRQAAEGNAVTLSVEGGFPIGISDHWVVEPQAQLINQRITLDSPNAENGTNNELNTWSGRVGARLKGSYQVNGLGVEPYVRTNLWHTVQIADNLTLDKVDKISSSRKSSTVEVGLGLVARVTPVVSLYISADYSSDVDDNDLNGLIGSLGVRMRW
ncbi:autotransporter outer membrane beta-barrel domain-containing protein [Pseudomonas hefeiensis]|uniref:Autotransporter outer membrane beta-barrel domain-containing protein n=1 Tax=Pseudomonas hefeiensis TaxID=2738125 RepID=A0ABY9G3U9_9PSED|nr:MULTISPECIES: autotransporter outer membrane beta-barrel domain-containing protein [unclassified Pseudomonas]WLH10279.1 autotransporter outer membrane beta-barrel domain-containing protein [Pseudomonas sp. FP205]WLH93358.1 autotransporter outer membrane beta-barrel domain-containing protein [Pseudomonas sp. FP53]WLI37646.1 autotransporter outer membrane beta-barrel domain-containing protein [Pseudomonas sp. FP821]